MCVIGAASPDTLLGTASVDLRPVEKVDPTAREVRVQAWELPKAEDIKVAAKAADIKAAGIRAAATKETAKAKAKTKEGATIVVAQGFSCGNAHGSGGGLRAFTEWEEWPLVQIFAMVQNVAEHKKKEKNQYGPKSIMHLAEDDD